MGKLEYEDLWILSLNQNNMVTNKICVSRGGTSATVGDVKLILKELLQRMAIGAIMVHNHPSDSLRPSRQDDDLTQRVKRGCDAVGITFLDHVIVTRDGFYSYGDNAIL